MNQRGGILRPVWLEIQRAQGRPPLSSPLTQIPSILCYKHLMIIFFPRKLQHLISPTPPSLLPKWLWVRVWLKSDDDLRRQRSPSTLFGLLRPLSYMRPPKFTYVEYLSFPKVLDGTSGCADRLQTSVNDQPVRQNLYYLISRSCCTWSKWCKCVGVLISTAAVHSFPLHITVVILTAWNNSAGLVDVFCKCLNLFLFMLSTAS